jgi:hypothetical protein
VSRRVAVVRTHDATADDACTRQSDHENESVQPVYSISAINRINSDG